MRLESPGTMECTVFDSHLANDSMRADCNEDKQSVDDETDVDKFIDIFRLVDVSLAVGYFAPIICASLCCLISLTEPHHECV